MVPGRRPRSGDGLPAFHRDAVRAAPAGGRAVTGRAPRDRRLAGDRSVLGRRGADTVAAAGARGRGDRRDLHADGPVPEPRGVSRDRRPLVRARSTSSPSRWTPGPSRLPLTGFRTMFNAFHHFTAAGCRGPARRRRRRSADWHFRNPRPRALRHSADARADAAGRAHRDAVRASVSVAPPVLDVRAAARAPHLLVGWARVAVAAYTPVGARGSSRGARRADGLASRPAVPIVVNRPAT